MLMQKVKVLALAFGCPLLLFLVDSPQSDIDASPEEIKGQRSFELSTVSHWALF